MTGVHALRGGVMVCGTTSDAGKSFIVAGLCRLLARNGIRVAPFKAQNMANNAAVTSDGGEIGHAQWIQALAAGTEPLTAMNPILLKPMGQQRSQVVVQGEPIGEMSAADYMQARTELFPVVLAALDTLRDRYDVVVCEGAGSPAEINLLDRDIVNLALADAADLPALVVGDIDRGGVFAALYGTVTLLPERLRSRVRGFVINKFRGDPRLLGSACTELERRSGVPTLGVVPHLTGADLDAEDSLTLDNWGREYAAGGVLPPRTAHGTLDVVAVRWPAVSNAGDLDPLRSEPGVTLRWIRSADELGHPDLIVLPGSKATRADLDWFRTSGLSGAVERLDTPVIAICAGLQMCGETIDDPEGVEGPPGSKRALGWLPVATTYAASKVLDRPRGRAVDGPGRAMTVAGYRIHHGRVRSGEAASPWLLSDDGTVLGWYGGRVCGTTLHGLFEHDRFRAAVLAWVAGQAGKPWVPSEMRFAETRRARLDRMADALDTHLDLERIAELITEGAPVHGSTYSVPAQQAALGEGR
jgi:adenosylcobyric acid synthase